jgi:PPOX class probable F420-dependent enzyme
MKLNESIRSMLDGRNFATVSTLNPDGGPQASVVWVMRDDDKVLFTVTSTKQKARNLARDPRVSVTIFDLANPYHSVELRGTAKLTEDPDKTLSKKLSQKYLDEDPPNESPDEVRLIVSVTADKITEFSS